MLEEPLGLVRARRPSKRLGQWAALAALLVVLPAAPTALGGKVEKVQVGVSGRNATEGLSPILFVDVPVVSGYTVAKFDGEQGDWTGPPYRATLKPGSGRTDLSFRSIFDNAVGSLGAMIQKALVHTDWTKQEAAAARVLRVLGGRTVGSVGGEVSVFFEPIDGAARYEAVLSLPLCNHVFGAVDFYADAPPQDSSGTAGQYLVSTVHAAAWNRAHVISATKAVELDGPLPGGRVAARAAGRAVAGTVGDCGGGLQHVPLTLQRESGLRWTAAGRGVSGPGGKFTLQATTPGTYRVTATLGPFGATSVSATVR